MSKYVFSLLSLATVLSKIQYEKENLELDLEAVKFAGKISEVEGNKIISYHSDRKSLFLWFCFIFYFLFSFVLYFFLCFVLFFFIF